MKDALNSLITSEVLKTAADFAATFRNYQRIITKMSCTYTTYGWVVEYEYKHNGETTNLRMSEQDLAMWDAEQHDACKDDPTLF